MIKINNILSGRSPLGSLPFVVKLIISLVMDTIGIAFFITYFAGFLSGIGIPLAIPAFLTAKVYSVIMAIIAYLFWSSPMFSFLIGVEEATLQAFPLMTVICIWNGYKTGWRY